MLFRELDGEEELSFRNWSRSTYKVGEPISGIWHPVVQEECVKMNIEQASFHCDQSE